jgi:dTDP-glucose 4,6-dehydratase
MTTRILVTGGAGFIGSHYVRTLLGPQGPRDVSVTVLDKLTYAGNTANLDAVRGHEAFGFVRGDICDAELVARLMGDHDQVVHFAAESHVDRSIDGGAEFVRTNVLGTHTLVDAAHRAGVETFVHISTDDLIALSYHRTHGLDVRVTRCSNNYGHHHFPEKLIPLFVTNLLDGKKVPLYGDGGNVRDWLHVDDHVRAIELVRTRGRAGEIYNIGGGTELANKELTALILVTCGARWDTSVMYVEDRKGHDQRYSVDWTKIREELGYEPRVKLEQGLRETVQWYRDQRVWWEPLLERAAL